MIFQYFTIFTLNGFFLVRWRDPRLIIENVDFGDNEPLIPVDVSLVDSIWMPDIEILNLKEFATLDVLSKLEGLWLNQNLELIYAVACRITWICPMTFDSFPLDVQVHIRDLCCLSSKPFVGLQISSGKLQL